MLEASIHIDHEKLLQTYERSFDKWKSTGLLDELSHFNALKLSQILQNQVSFQEDHSTPEMKKYLPKIISVAFKKHLETNIVDFQPLSTPGNIILYKEPSYNGWGNFRLDIKTKPVTSATRKLQMQFNNDMISNYYDINHHDIEDSITGVVGEQLYFDQNREHITDLQQASEKIECSKKHLLATVKSLTGQNIDGAKFDFVILSPEMNHEFGDSILN